jgi:hypothetical protein
VYNVILEKKCFFDVDVRDGLDKFPSMLAFKKRIELDFVPHKEMILIDARYTNFHSVIIKVKYCIFKKVFFVILEASDYGMHLQESARKEWEKMGFSLME